MNKTILFFSTLFTTFSLSLVAQNTDVISTGSGYSKFAYYKLSDGSSEQVANEAWDIAFSNLDAQSPGIFINESTKSSMGQTVPGAEAYDPFVFDFSQTINPGDIFPEFQLFNPEASWAEGAFNTPADTSDPNDYGWGAYDAGQGKVIGYRVFVIKLRNGAYRKISFDEFDGTQYSFRVADLDGNNMTSHTVNTDFGNGSPLLYFSLGPNGATVTTPKNWDLVFCRYVALLDAGGDLVPYAVTGILSGNGVQVARATNVDPMTVNYMDYLDSFSTRLDVINHDWKFFNLSTGWVVSSDRAYFVKTAQNDLYKLVFTAFGGSGNGNATVERTYIGNLSAAPDLPTGISEVLVYPNPVLDRLSVSFTAEDTGLAMLRLRNAAGRLVWEGRSQVAHGLNVLELNQLPGLPAGMYTLQVQVPTGQFTRAVIVRK
ncbi:MAG: T9SS type A sorting domain-containing protein [Bacteroidetes bacterium]|nr:MAG: T9SS type A sorting domain-containing protein [Bacteroidota bacterium]